MKAELFVVTVVLLATAIIADKQTLSPKLDICRLFKDGVKLRKPGFCDRQIICENFESVDGLICTGSTPYYSRSKSKCVASDDDDYCESPCYDGSPRFVRDEKHCQGWYECRGGMDMTNGQCISNLYFDESKQICNYPELVECEATYDFCDVVPKDTPFKDEGHCNQFITCTSTLLGGTKPKTEVCPSGQYFDAATAECVPKAEVECEVHPHPDEVCGNAKVSVRDGFVGDGATCRGYYFCRDYGTGTPDKDPIWGQCADTHFFDVEEQACLPRWYVKCEEDRCDSRGNERELSGTIGCQHYLDCSNGRTVSEVSCDNNMYFDIETLECTKTKKSYPACSL